MVVDGMSTNIRIGKTRLVLVREFCHLGSVINTKNSHLTMMKRNLTMIKRMIVMAKQAFQRRKNLPPNRHVCTETKREFVKTFVCSVLIYGCETWAFEKQVLSTCEETI